MAWFHTNGPSPLYFNGALMGYGEDGAEISTEEFHRDCISDVFGPMVPGDEQMMLETAMISSDLVQFNWAGIQAALAKSRLAAPGIMPIAGSLIGANGGYGNLTIPSLLDGVPWKFPSARLIGAVRHKVGTVRTMVSVVFRAIPFRMGSDTSGGAVLYSH